MGKIMRNMLIISWALLIVLSACTPPLTLMPATTSAPRATATPHPKSTQAPTWTPTLTPTTAPTAPPRPTSTTTHTRTPFPTRAPRTATPTVAATGTATATGTVTATGAVTAPLTGTPTATPRPPKLLLGAFDELRARVLIYGPHATTSIRPKLSQAYTQAGLEKYLLLAEIPGKDCRDCSASIGGAVFEKVGNDWKVVVEDKHIITLGAFGRAPTGDFIKLGADTYGVRFNDPYTKTNTLGNRLIIITAAEGRLRIALDVITAVAHYAENGTAEWYYNSDVTFVAGKNENYDDIQITTYGTQPLEGNITEFTETTTYTFGRWDYYQSSKN